MFKWCQLHHSFVKLDTGLISAFIVTTLCFSNENVALIVFDSLLILFAIAYIFLNKYFLRYEQTANLITVLVIRIVFEGYVWYRLIYTINNITGPEENKLFFDKGYGKPITFGIVILNSIILILTVFVSYKCLSNFGKGLREMINQQTKDDESLTETLESESSHN